MPRRYAWIVYERDTLGPVPDLRRVIEVTSTVQLNDKDPPLQAPPPPAPHLIVREVDHVDADRLHGLMQARELYWNIELLEWQRNTRWEG